MNYYNSNDNSNNNSNDNSNSNGAPPKKRCKLTNKNAILSFDKMSMGELINHAKMHNIVTPSVLETKKRGKYLTGLTGQEKLERRYVQYLI